MVVYPISNGDKVEKYHVGILFDKSTTDTPDYIQLCKATENTINLNPETEDRDFINMKTKETLVKSYKPSLSNPLTLVKGDADYEYFWPKFYKLPTGASAKGKMLVVFTNEYTESGSGESATVTYDAWLCDTTFIMQTLDPVNSQLTFDTNINNWVEGTVTIDSDGKPTFTKAA